HLVARDHAQRGRLAAARRTEECQELAGAHIEHDIAGGVDLALHAVGITLRDPVDVHADRFPCHRFYPPSRLVIGTAPGARKRRNRRPMTATTMNTITTTNTENGAAGPRDSSVMFSRDFA